jgi:cytochrome c553
MAGPSASTSASCSYRTAGAVSFAAAAVLACALCLAFPAIATPTRVDQLVHTALELEPNAKRGASLYVEQCSQCHGMTAFGNAIKVIPALAGQRTAYIIKQLADFAELERQGREMHQVVAKPGVSEPQAWADLAAHLSALPATLAPETGNGEGVELGEAIYHEQCASCHEEDARGDEEGFIPSLRDQHYSYLLRQMRGLAAWHRSNVDEDLVRFIDSLDTEELTSVSDYLSRQRGPTRDRAQLRDDGKLRN